MTILGLFSDKVKTNFDMLVSLKTRVNSRYEAPMLSHQVIVGLWIGCLSSWRRELSQIISAVVLVTGRYTAPVDDRATIGCFLAGQDNKFHPIYTGKPLMDLLSSVLPAQSTSQKAWSWELVEWVIKRPWCKVALTYRRTCLQDVQWVVVGADKNWHNLFTTKAKSGRVDKHTVMLPRFSYKWDQPVVHLLEVAGYMC